MNPLYRLIDGLDLPEGCDTWGIKSVRPDLSTLRRADLTDADLTGADLTGADLANANLSGAYLTSFGGNVEEKQCESSDCPVVLYTGEECPACGR